MKKVNIQIRLDEKEKENFKENAQILGMSITGYVKYLNLKTNLNNRGDKYQKNI